MLEGLRATATQSEREQENERERAREREKENSDSSPRVRVPPADTLLSDIGLVGLAVMGASQSQSTSPVDPSIVGNGAVDPLNRQGTQPGPGNE